MSTIHSQPHTPTNNQVGRSEINPDSAEQADMVPAIISDGDDAAQVIAPAEPVVAAIKPADPEKPKFAPNPRDDIAARFRNRRSTETPLNPEGPFAAPAHVAADEDGDPDALTGYEPPVIIPERDQTKRVEQTNEARRYNVKVRGNEFALTRAELIEQADLDTSDPDLAGMSDIQLVKIAQKSIAANEYVAEARDLVKRSRTTSRDSSSTPPVAQAERDDDFDASTTSQVDPFEDAIEKITFGDRDEAKSALQKAIQHSLSESDTQRAREAITIRDKQDIADFGAANADVVEDEDAQGLLRSIATREALKDLRSLGITDAEIRAEGLLDNPTKTMQALTAARTRGMKVRSPGDLLASAAPIVRQRLGMAAPQNTPAIRQQPAPVASSRQDAKRGLIQQPARVGTAPVAQAGAVEPKSRSNAVAKMRQMRGQSVPS